MSEEEWVAVVAADKDTREIQAYLRGKGSPRKLRLFACGCCRSIEASLTDPRSRQAVDVAEKYADRATKKKELAAAYQDAVRAGNERGEARDNPLAIYAAIAAHWCAIPLSPGVDAVVQAAHAAFWSFRAVEGPGEAEVQGRLLCDVLGRPPSLVPGPIWLTAVVIAVARTIYDERRFAEMPVLADALEDAGCADADVLDHCRAGKPHALGCWVLDLILGKR